MNINKKNISEGDAFCFFCTKRRALSVHPSTSLLAGVITFIYIHFALHRAWLVDWCTVLLL